MILALVLLLLTTALALAQPVLVQQAIDRDVANGETDDLWWIVGAVPRRRWCSRSSSGTSQALLMVQVSQRVMNDIRLQLFRHLQRMSIAFYDANPVGRLVTRLTNDIAALERAADGRRHHDHRRPVHDRRRRGRAALSSTGSWR